MFCRCQLLLVTNLPMPRIFDNIDASLLPALQQTISGVGSSTRRVRPAFDVETVTKRFHGQFRAERAAFLKFVTGITDVADRECYASVMLNRLMFVYFVQRKGFLDGDRDYLRSRLATTRRKHGNGSFPSFYRHFLLRLFHDGLGGRARPPELEKLLGKIPYLNGGLFERHKIERDYPDIQIPDKAFERIFDCFDQYQWHLDERPCRADNEINPDVLGFIFERYINDQAQMGAYYTSEDITEYIAKSTLLPFLFDAARQKCRIAFKRDEQISPANPTIWDLLKRDPDRYIYPAVRHGLSWDIHGDGGRGAPLHQPRALPADIEAGREPTKPNLAQRRKGWNREAPAELGLPAELWREVIARRERCEALREKLRAGDVREINDFITLNLDLRQFAKDVIAHTDSPDLLRAFWHAIERVTVLDPTCGSGAFLFAALNILEPLYEACLDRMEAFLRDEAARIDPGRQTARGCPLLPHRKLEDFSTLLDRVASHPSRRYFIVKSIILGNLFGVDLMEEAAEICKLRLFLKLAAQVEPDPAKPNLGIEPLPDIDFNIRCGNTLVGCAAADELRRVFRKGVDRRGKHLPGECSSACARFEDRVRQAAMALRTFREMQTQRGRKAGEFAAAKEGLRHTRKKLEDDLNGHLATEYGVKNTQRSAWLKSHAPFHWFVEFFGIINDGGFAVIIGNPPYVSATKVRKQYTVKDFVTGDAPDIYAWVLERSQMLLRDGGRCGMIVPLSLGFSSDFDACRRLLLNSYGTNWFSSFGRIPAALFSSDVRVRNTIHIGHKSRRTSGAYTSRLHRWFEAGRATLFQSLEYAPFQPALWKYRIPKLSTARLASAFERALAASTHTLDTSTSSRATGHVLHFKKSAYNWLNFCRAIPPCFQGDRRVEHTKFGELYFSDEATCQLALLLANGKLMMIFWFAIADDFDVTRWNFADFPADLSKITMDQRERLLALVPQLEEAMRSAVQFKLNAGRRVGNYNLARCRDVTDRSDSIFAEALGFADVWDDIELYYVQTMKTDFSGSDGGQRVIDPSGSVAIIPPRM